MASDCVKRSPTFATSNLELGPVGKPRPSATEVWRSVDEQARAEVLEALSDGVRHYEGRALGGTPSAEAFRAAIAVLREVGRGG